MLQDLLEGWRAEGHLMEDVQVWALGYAGQGGMAPTFAGGSTSCLMADPSSGPDGVYAGWGASIDDLYLIDRAGQVRYATNLVPMNLTKKPHRETVDGWVRTLLEE